MGGLGAVGAKSLGGDADRGPVADEPYRNDGSPILRVDRVSVALGAGELRREVLDAITLDVAAGEFVTVVGASGCGKTTLLRTIAGLVEPTTGAVDLGTSDLDRWRRMGFVFQYDSLFPWRTVSANVRLGYDLARRRRSAEAADRAQECIDLVRLTGYEGHYPHQLSGGMRQRVNLARAIAIDPPVLLMDEPFAALDAQTREIMQDELLQIWRQSRKTVVFVTHQLDEAVFLADRVLVMSSRPGRIREVVHVDLPRPRALSVKRSPEFVDRVERIWHLIEREVRQATAPGAADEP